MSYITVTQTGEVNWNGETPIIFSHDRPDLGGFVCPTTVCTGEMWKLGQLKAGSTVRFHPINYDDALEITRKQDSYLQALAARLNGSPFSIPSPLIDLRGELTSSILHQIPPSGSHPMETYRQGGDMSIIIEYGN